jgi:hypothetical protein
MFGQRTIAFQSGTGSDSSELIILDFDPCRLRAYNMPDAHVQGAVCAPGGGTPEHSRDFTGETVFCSGGTPVSKMYVRTTFHVGGDIDVLDSVMIDDEHGRCMRMWGFHRFLTASLP